MRNVYNIYKNVFKVIKNVIYVLLKYVSRTQL